MTRSWYEKSIPEELEVNMSGRIYPSSIRFLALPNQGISILNLNFRK